MADYIVPFYESQIEVTATKKATIVDHWILQTVHTRRRRLHKLLISLNIKWLPCSKPEDEHSVALLQLSIGDRCLIFQLLHRDFIPQSLVDFLIDPNNTFVGIGVEGDVEKLLCDHGLYVANTVDLNKLALLTYGEEIYGKMDLKRMAKAVLGKVMEKQLNNTLSKWDDENLSYEQVEYCAIDAFTSFEIGKNLFNIMSDRDSRRVKFQSWLLLKETLRRF
ncbi:3'-5' exonuclease-like [Nicotiana sylvestris]|uniref:Werner syndrome ATP-dependent helicase homolog n=1 Tax=Nicotiana sylvestris TaxID=4096 RepID=A0A1U7XYF5_NICSY|nr:PREDICTED: Werner syndrome ATP-dependent helicase homolog [Nicotiana sylvestris]